MIKNILCVIVGTATLLLLTVNPVLADSNHVQFDFESGDLQGWRVVEGWFEHPVSDRAVFHNRYSEIPMNHYNKQGRFYLSTVERKTGPSNDQMTGVVESPVFVLEGDVLRASTSFNPQAIRGALSALMLEYGVNVVSTHDSDETAPLLAMMTRHAPLSLVNEHGRLVHLLTTRNDYYYLPTQ